MLVGFDKWWHEDGRMLDPDTGDVPWFDKRQALAELAFEAGIQCGMARAANYTADDAEMPERVDFANGRFVRIVDNPAPGVHNGVFLEVGQREGTMPSEVKFTQDFLEHAAVCTSQYDSTCRAMAAEILALRAEIAKPWEHSDHWRNPETGYIECSCCCGWALDAERDHKRIAALQSQLDAKWISVEERLPEANDEVWVWVEYHNQDDALGDTSWLQDDGTWAMGSAKNFTVTRWQPLPPPPSGAKGETKP